MAERSPHQLMTRQAMSAAPWNDLPNLASPRPEKRIDKPGRPDEIGARIHSPTVRMTRKQTTPRPAKYPRILGLPEAAIDVSRPAPDLMKRVYIVTSSPSRGDVAQMLTNATNGTPPPAHFFVLFVTHHLLGDRGCRLGDMSTTTPNFAGDHQPTPGAEQPRPECQSNARFLTARPRREWPTSGANLQASIASRRAPHRLAGQMPFHFVGRKRLQPLDRCGRIPRSVRSQEQI